MIDCDIEDLVCPPCLDREPHAHRGRRRRARRRPRQLEFALPSVRCGHCDRRLTPLQYCPARCSL